MSAQRLETLPRAALARPSPPRAAILAQRRSTLGGGSALAPPLLDQGRPLPTSTRSEMERGFGRDFGAVRVHDDARAHDNARSMGAVAYAAGNDIVFAEGRYAPQTAAGRALIAHELAHSVQQGGVQMKAEGPLPIGADSRLEAEADQAALAVTAGRPAPALTRIDAPAVFRQTAQPLPEGGTEPKPAIEEIDVPEVGKVRIEEDLPGGSGVGATFSRVSMPPLQVPHKGAGEWVKAAYSAAASGGSLFYVGSTTGGKFKAISDPEAGYADLWIRKYGFTSLRDVAKALRQSAAAKPLQSAKAKTILAAFAKESFALAHCDIDHIVEKQLQGSNIAENLQLLGKRVNRSSGARLGPKLADMANKVRDRARPNVDQIMLRFPVVEVEAKATVDDEFLTASHEIETRMRSPDIKGDPSVRASADGVPVGLLAGGKAAVANIRATGPTDLASPANLLITAMRLETYRRGGRGADTVTAKPKIPGLTEESPVTLTATRVDAPGQVETAGSDSSGEAPDAPAAKEGPTEYRRLSITKSASRALKARFPFLSPVTFTDLTIEDDGLHGIGTIIPTKGLLPPLAIVFTPKELWLSVRLDPRKFPSIDSVIHFTGGSIDLLLAPDFKGSGTLGFSVGPRRKPLLRGEIEASVDNGIVIAKGTKLQPAKIPGIDQLTGEVSYRSDTGWSGWASATASKLPATAADAKLSFRQEPGGRVQLKAEGGVVARVGNKSFHLKAHWSRDGGLSFHVQTRWQKPFAIVDSIEADARFDDDELLIAGKGQFNFRNIWKGTIAVTYHKREGSRSKFYGDGDVDVKTKDGKGEGKVIAHIDEKGDLTGHGEITYQIGKIRPKFMVTLSKDNKLTLGGTVVAGPYTLFDRKPKEGEGFKNLFTLTGKKIDMPTPILGVTVYAKLKASAQYQVYFGPGVVRTLALSGSFDPLEENANVIASLDAKFTCEAGAVLKGNLEAELGAELLRGAVSAGGGINIEPKLTGAAFGKADAHGEYADGDFTLSLKPECTFNLTAGLKVDGKFTVSALWNLWSHTWKFPITDKEIPLGSKTLVFPELTMKLGGGNSLDKQPDTSSLLNLDPMGIVMGIVADRNDTATRNPDYDPNYKPEREWTGRMQ